MADLVEVLARAMADRIMREETGISLPEGTKAALLRAVDRFAPQCMADARACLIALEAAGYRVVPFVDGSYRPDEPAAAPKVDSPAAEGGSRDE